MSIKNLVLAVMMIPTTMSQTGCATTLDQSMEAQRQQLVFIPGDPANAVKRIIYTDPGQPDMTALDKQIQHPKINVKKNKDGTITLTKGQNNLPKKNKG